MSVGKKKILYVSRFTNDFERFLALADYASPWFEQEILHIFPLERLKNINLYFSLKTKIRLTDFSSYSEDFSRYQGLIQKAREAKSSVLYQCSQYFLKEFEKKIFSFARKFLEDFSPDIVVMTISGSDIKIPGFLALWKVSMEKQIPVVFMSHGVGLYGIPQKIIPRTDKICAGDFFFVPSFEEENGFYQLPHVCDPVPKKIYHVGDARLAQGFLNGLKNYYQQNNIQMIRGSVAVFGTNHCFLEDGKTIHQEEYLFQILSILAKKGVDCFFVKFHPNVSATEYRQKIMDLPGVETFDADTVCTRILCQCEYVVTPPSSIVFESALLGVKTLVINPLKDYFDLSELGFSVIDLRQLEDFDLTNLQTITDLSRIQKICQAGQNDGECRRKMVEAIREIILYRENKLDCCN